MNNKLLTGVAILLTALLTAGLVMSLAKPIVVERVVERLGAFPGPEITSPFLSVNGVEIFNSSQKLNQATTSICSLKSPSATSTLVHGSVKWTTGTTTQIAMELGKSVGSAATTTSLGYNIILSTRQGTMLASTTPAAFALSTDLDPPNVFAPNNYFVAKIGGAAGDLNVLVGSCKAQWLVN